MSTLAKRIVENFVKKIICVKLNFSTAAREVAKNSVTFLPRPSEDAALEESFRFISPAVKKSPEFGLIRHPIRVDLGSGKLSPKNVQLSADLIREANRNKKTGNLTWKNAEEFYLSSLAEFLSKEYKEPVFRENLVVTNGASVSLLAVLSLLFPNKCPVFVEELSYFLTLEALKTKLNFPVIGIPFGNEGIDISALEKALRTEKSKIHLGPIESHGFMGLLYLVPAFHNPTGAITPPEKLQEIVQLARKYRILVVCDDVYNLLYFNTSHPPRRLFSYDNEKDPDYVGNVISNGSFSKFLSSQIKMGWMELPPWLKSIYMTNQTKLFCDAYISAVSCELLANTLQSGAASGFVAGLRQDYIEHKAIVCWILESELLEGCTFTVPQGGTFFWIELPHYMSAKKVQEEALNRYGIYFLNGQRCSANSSGNYQNCLRISISYNDRNTLIRSVRELCAVIRDVQNMEEFSVSYWYPGHA